MSATGDELATVFRRECGLCTATLIRILGDVELAEDAVAEAFAIAAEAWPRSGTPPNPGAWITTTAHNRAIDRLRRESSRSGRHLAAHRLLEANMESEPNPELAEFDDFVDVVADDQLRLMFLCCHPALGVDAQVALTLRLLGGFKTPDIAKAFLVAEETMAQRLVRAKRKLRDNHAPYRVPSAAELPDRLHAVLAAISVVFTAGHTAIRGDELLRVDLCDEAIRLARVVVELMPDEPEALGLLALTLLTDARRDARTDADGRMIRLADQDRARWDRARIAEGHLIMRACLRRNQPGMFQIQAAIAAVHADAATAAATDWRQIVALYDQLFALRPDAVVAINRAVAIGELDGPGAGLLALELIDADGVASYQPFHATRADLLARSGRREESDAAYSRAIELTENPIERRFLTEQRAC
ncbi:MAG: sigma-70 family RNA polymerase sigma factor [Actinomycetia bacterium]|nr:sigma-70 family RNA polymerase sigma factor [Actinomycetes bacterium]